MPESEHFIAFGHPNADLLGIIPKTLVKASDAMNHFLIFITQAEDGHGNIVETETTVTKTYLYIVTEHKTAEEMAAYDGFNEDQRQQLSELLSEENEAAWKDLL